MSETNLSNIFNPPAGTFRAVFLYVGQGEATLLLVPDGNDHIPVLIDINKDEENSGVDVAELLKGKIDNNELIFINTHPHDDHIDGIEELNEAVGIKQVWHSGHKPSQKYGDAFKKLEKVLKSIGESNIFYLRGTNDLNALHTNREKTSKTTIKLGDIDFHVFSPAKYVCDDVDNETPEQRRQKIHEECGVIQFSYAGKSILITGDADKKAWERITEYFGDDLKSDIFSAPHHGSRTAFKEAEDDEDPYTKHLEKISPEFIVISAPKQTESPHDHPHDDAMSQYEKFVTKDNILHLGKNRESVIVDIDSSGNISFNSSTKDISSKKIEPSDILYSTPAKSKPYCSYL